MSRRRQPRPSTRAIARGSASGFRRPGGRRNWPFQSLAAVGGVLMFGFMAVERFPEHVGALPELTAFRVIEGPVSHVRDGDTIEVAGTPVRFGSLDCAERGTVRGDAATRRMRDLVAAQSLSCALNGRTSYDLDPTSSRHERIPTEMWRCAGSLLPLANQSSFSKPRVNMTDRRWLPSSKPGARWDARHPPFPRSRSRKMRSLNRPETSIRIPDSRPSRSLTHTVFNPPSLPILMTKIGLPLTEQALRPIRGRPSARLA